MRITRQMKAYSLRVHVARNTRHAACCVRVEPCRDKSRNVPDVIVLFVGFTCARLSMLPHPTFAQVVLPSGNVAHVTSTERYMDVAMKALDTLGKLIQLRIDADTAKWGPGIRETPTAYGFLAPDKLPGDVRLESSFPLHPEVPTAGGPERQKRREFAEAYGQRDAAQMATRACMQAKLRSRTGNGTVSTTTAAATPSARAASRRYRNGAHGHRRA